MRDQSLAREFESSPGHHVTFCLSFQSLLRSPRDSNRPAHYRLALDFARDLPRSAVSSAILQGSREALRRPGEPVLAGKIGGKEKSDSGEFESCAGAAFSFVSSGGTAERPFPTSRGCIPKQPLRDSPSPSPLLLPAERF